MAIKHICDGCFTPIDGDPLQIGHVVKRDYCDECGSVAAHYMAKLDDVHDKAAKVFSDGMTELREHYADKLNALPDYYPPESEE